MNAGADTAFGALKQVDAGLLSVGYAEAGPAGGPAVILLHGWPYDIHSYAEATPMLVAAGYRVIVPYLRGYGTTRFLSEAALRNGQQAPSGSRRLRRQVHRPVRAPDHLGRCRAQPAARGPAGFRRSHHRRRRLVTDENHAASDSVTQNSTMREEFEVGTITTADGTEIFYKDWGTGQPIVFSHGWPLSADDWDTQMMFFLLHGYRVIAHDRRGHGRSTQTSDGHDMDHYADDLAALTAHLDLQNAVHVGHSTGGGEVAHYVARHGESRVARAVLISSVPPLMLKTDANPGGLPKEVFDGLQAQVATRRSQFYREFASGPFYGYNRPGAEPSEAIIENWWRQGMMGGAKAHYDGIVAFSQTDFTEDLKRMSVPVLVMHGDDDQVVPYADSGPLSAKLVQNGTLKTYSGFPHGMPTTQADTINADLLAWLQS